MFIELLRILHIIFIVVIAVGLGAQAAIARQYANMSVTSIFVNTGSTATDSRLSANDADAIAERCQSVSSAAPLLTGKLAVSQGTLSV